MSDMLEKLLRVEKTAAGLVTEAESEAARRTGQTRLESQKALAAMLKETAGAAEAAVTEERARIGAERAQKNLTYRETLARTPANAEAFRIAALSFMEKSGT